jgi:hypothetical protein
MQDKASSPSLSDLLSLRIGVVLRDEDDYQRIYENRIRRFTAMQRAGGEFGPRAEETIKITADAREVAEVLRTELEASAAAAARRRAEMIELVITADRRIIARVETPSAVAESLRPLEEKAYDFLRSLANADESVFGERSVAEVLRERFAEESEEHRDLISGITARLIMMWQSEGQRAKILSILVQLGRIYRGLFYVGVLKATGGALERDALKASLSDFLVELVVFHCQALGSSSPRRSSLISLNQTKALTSSRRLTHWRLFLQDTLLFSTSGVLQLGRWRTRCGAHEKVESNTRPNNRLEKDLRPCSLSSRGVASQPWR